MRDEPRSGVPAVRLRAGGRPGPVSIITPTLPERAGMLMELSLDVTLQTVMPDRWIVELDMARVGPARIRNAIVADVDTHWVAFVDDDDRLDPNHLEVLLDHCAGAHVVYTMCRVEGRAWTPDHDCSHHLDEINTVPMTALVDREAFLAAGGFLEGARDEDWALWRQLRRLGATFRCVHETTWTYRFHGTNRSLEGVTDGG